MKESRRGGGRRRCLRGAALGLLAAAMAAACSRPPAPAASEPPRNVLLILVDTLRADHLSAYGYPRSTSPSLDRLAAASLFFRQARSQAACTFPSVNSILTGRYPMRFLGQPGGLMGIPDSAQPLAAIFAARGFATAAVSASPIVRVTPSRFNPHGGFGRGFEHFDETCLWREADCVTRRALAWLRHRPAGKPFFLYLHYMDPHDPYQPPPTWQRRFAGPYAGKEWVAQGDPLPLQTMIHAGGPKVDLTRDDLQHLLDLYDDEIAYFDSSLGRLLDQLDKRGLARDTVVALVADHGEQFLEHGDVKHCRGAWEAETRIPLAVRIPGRAAQRIDSPVEVVALAPTLLDAVGISPSGLDFEAASLLAGPPADGVAKSSQGPFRSATDGRYKLIYDMAKGVMALYDLRVDPQEHHDVAAQHPDRVAALREPLYAWLRRTEGHVASPKSLEAAQEAEKQLRALGYIQ